MQFRRKTDEVGSYQHPHKSEFIELKSVKRTVPMTYTRYTVPEGVLTEDGRMESFNNDLVIRNLDRVVVKEDGYGVAFKAGVTVEVEV